MYPHLTAVELGLKVEVGIGTKQSHRKNLDLGDESPSGSSDRHRTKLKSG